MEVQHALNVMEAKLWRQQTYHGAPAKDLTDALGYILAYLWACANDKVESLPTGYGSSDDFAAWTTATKHRYLGYTPSLDQVAFGAGMVNTSGTTRAGIGRPKENRADAEQPKRNSFQAIPHGYRKMLLYASER